MPGHVYQNDAACDGTGPPVGEGSSELSSEKRKCHYVRDMLVSQIPRPAANAWYEDRITFDVALFLSFFFNQSLYLLKVVDMPWPLSISRFGLRENSWV